MADFDWRLWLVKAGFLFGAFVVLRVLNLPQGSRHLQRWIPLAALLALAAYLLVVVIFEATLGGVSELYEIVASWILPLLEAVWLYLGLHSITFMLFGILCIWAFVAVKCILLGIALSVAAVRRISNRVRVWLRRAESSKKVSSLYPAYELDSTGSAILKSGWYYKRTATGVAGLVLIVFLMIAITIHVPRDLAVLLQTLPVKIWWPSYVLLAVFLVEFYWYLGGVDPDRAAETVSGEDVSARRGDASKHLLRHYESLWPNDWLVRAVRRTDAEEKVLSQDEVVRDPDEPEWVQILSNGEDLVLARFENERCQRDLFNAFTEKLAHGSRLLFLVDEQHWNKPEVPEELDAWLTQGFSLIEGGAIPWKWELGCDAPSAGEQIWVCTSQAIGDHLSDHDYGQSWLGGVSLVIFLDADGDSSLLSTRYSLAEAFGFDSGRGLLVLAGDGRRIESAFRENLKLTTRVKKYTLARPRPNVTGWIWRTDSQRSYETQLLEGAIIHSMGAEMSLAVPALSDPGIDRVLLVDSDHVPMHDFERALQSNVGRPERWLKWTDINGEERSYAFDEGRLTALHHVGMWSLHEISNTKVIIAHDEACNFPLLLERLAAKSDSDIHVHIMARPFLLRQYFSAHIEFFLANPLVPLVPMVTDLLRTVAERIIHQMLTVGLKPESLAAQLRDADVHFHSPEVGLWQILNDQFSVDIFREGLLENVNGRFRLNRRIKDHPSVSWLRLVSLIATDAGRQEGLGEVRAEHVYQQFLPEQRFTFNGKLYSVEQISPGAVQFEHRAPDRAVHEYRNHLALQYGLKPMVPAGNRQSSRRIGQLELRHGLRLIPDVAVSVLGYHEFETGEFRRYTQLTGIPTRRYQNARATLLEFRGEIPEEDAARLSFTLAVLCNELVPTLLPGKEKFCLICPLQEFLRNEGDPVTLILPEVDWETSREFFSSYDKSIGLLFIEDSESDLGLAQAFYDEVDYILGILHDYLYWIEHENKEFPDGACWQRNKGMDLPPFLCFGENAGFSEMLDLGGLEQLLQRWHIGEGGLIQRRHEFYSKVGSGSPSSGKDPIAVADERELAVCDICAFRGERGGFDEISDGRLRCSSCRKHAVDKVEDARKLYVDAVEFVEKQHDISIPLGGSVRLTDAKEIGQRSDRPFEPTPEFDGRAIGLAVKNPTGRWEVLVEMGMPDYMASSVLVHELTHIWQFENLDMDKAGLKLIEGHAVWSEVDFLESRRLVPHYVKGIKERQDPIYGEGYRELCQKLKSEDEESAFRYMLESFPRSRD